MTAIPFEYYVFEKVQDPGFAALYLHYALEDGGDEEFLHASRQYAEAHHMAGNELVLPEIVVESLKATLAISFDTYVSALWAAVMSSNVQDTPA